MVQWQGYDICVTTCLFLTRLFFCKSMSDSQHLRLLSLKTLAASPHKNCERCCGKMREAHLSTTPLTESERRRREQAATMKIKQYLTTQVWRGEQDEGEARLSPKVKPKLDQGVGTGKGNVKAGLASIAPACSRADRIQGRDK
jgi:hypothetical protein